MAFEKETAEVIKPGSKLWNVIKNVFRNHTCPTCFGMDFLKNRCKSCGGKGGYIDKDAPKWIIMEHEISHVRIMKDSKVVYVVGYDLELEIEDYHSTLEEAEKELARKSL